MTTPLFASSFDGKKHSFDSDELQWRPSVYAVVISDNKILLFPQRRGGYDLPGGGVEIDETCDSAVIREVKEETGIDVKVKKLITMRENFFAWDPDSPNDRKVVHSLCLYYACEMIGGEISTEGLDEYEITHADRAEWVDLAIFSASTPIATSIDYRPIVLETAKELNR